MGGDVDGRVGGRAVGDEGAEQRAGFAEGQGGVVCGWGEVGVVADEGGVGGGLGEEGLDEGNVGGAGQGGEETLVG